jgi:hypothetical protein
LSKANKPVRLYSVHTVQTVQCKHCTTQLLETSSAVVCTHSTAKLLSHVEATYHPRLELSPGGPERGQLTTCPTTQWEGPLSRVCNPFPSTGFPGLGGPRDCTPPKPNPINCQYQEFGGLNPGKIGPGIYIMAARRLARYTGVNYHDQIQNFVIFFALFRDKGSVSVWPGRSALVRAKCVQTAEQLYIGRPLFLLCCYCCLPDQVQGDQK